MIETCNLVYEGSYMKKYIWHVFIFVGCFIIGGMTRGLSHRFAIYAIHGTVAALPLAMFLYICFKRLEDQAIWMQTISLFVFSIVLGAMALVMAFYNIAAVVVAAIFAYLFPKYKAELLSGFYAFLSYPFAVLGGYLLKSKYFSFELSSFLMALGITAILSIAGVYLGKLLYQKVVKV